MAHLYASFADAALAEKAAGALLDYGVRQNDVSVVANDAYGQTRTTPGTDYGTDTASTSPISGLNAAGLEESAAIGAGGLGISGLGIAPLGMTGTAPGYVAGVGQGRAAAYGTPDEMATATPVGADLNPLDQGGPDSAINHAAHPNTDAAAKHGISTTTPEDAGEGAVKGTGIGLGVGILASLAALLVPGVGLVLGGGALAAALGGTALAAGAGAIAGGVTGYLKDQGVPSEAAERYHGAVQSGGAVLSLSVPSGSVDQATAEQVLSKYGASDVGTY